MNNREKERERERENRNIFQRIRQNKKQTIFFRFKILKLKHYFKYPFSFKENGTLITRKTSITHDSHLVCQHYLISQPLFPLMSHQYILDIV